MLPPAQLEGLSTKSLILALKPLKMKSREIRIIVDEYAEDELMPLSDESLMQHAMVALKGSYAPYSEFHVGAAILLDDQNVIIGSNQENAAYPSGLCAERVAIFHANAAYPNAKVKSIAITAKAESFVMKHPVTPCGACRQVIAETEKRQNEPIRIIMKGEKGISQVVNGVENLLPLMFHEEKLKKPGKE